MIDTMPKRKPPAEKPEPVSPKPQAKRSGKALNVWIDPKLRDLFAASAEKNKRLLNAETEIALTEYLVKRGLLQPKDNLPD